MMQILAATWRDLEDTVLSERGQPHGEDSLDCKTHVDQAAQQVLYSGRWVRGWGGVSDSGH